MAIHILVPQERLAELLKKEHELLLLEAGGVDNWVGHGEALYSPGPNGVPQLLGYQSSINELLDNGELAEHLGYDYTVDTDANYFASLEDMLSDEERGPGPR
jgi:hypothetical protein